MRWLVGAIVASLGTLPALAASPSFDCTRAATWSEKTICAHEGLAMLDREMADAFAARQAEAGDVGREQLLVDQRAWLAARDACRAEADGVGCLTLQYRTRIRQLLGRIPAGATDDADLRGALGECRRESAEAMAVGLCLDRKLAAASAAVGDAEAAMLHRLEDRTAVADAFRASQEAFLRFRDETCRWRSGLGGRDDADLRQACLVDFTRARTDEIQGLLR